MFFYRCVFMFFQSKASGKIGAFAQILYLKCVTVSPSRCLERSSHNADKTDHQQVTFYVTHSIVFKLLSALTFNKVWFSQAEEGSSQFCCSNYRHVRAYGFSNSSTVFL